MGGVSGAVAGVAVVGASCGAVAGGAVEGTACEQVMLCSFCGTGGLVAGAMAGEIVEYMEHNKSIQDGDDRRTESKASIPSSFDYSQRS